MGMSELSETIEEIEIFCDYCGKSLGFIKWFEDLTVPCPPCCKKTNSNRSRKHTQNAVFSV